MKTCPHSATIPICHGLKQESCQDAKNETQAAVGKAHPIVLLQEVDALPRDVAHEFVVFVEVPPVHLLSFFRVRALDL